MNLKEENNHIQNRKIKRKYTYFRHLKISFIMIYSLSKDEFYLWGVTTKFWLLKVTKNDGKSDKRVTLKVTKK